MPIKNCYIRSDLSPLLMCNFQQNSQKSKTQRNGLGKEREDNLVAAPFYNGACDGAQNEPVTFKVTSKSNSHKPVINSNEH